MIFRPPVNMQGSNMLCFLMMHPLIDGCVRYFDDSAGFDEYLAPCGVGYSSCAPACPLTMWVRVTHGGGAFGSVLLMVLPWFFSASNNVAIVIYGSNYYQLNGTLLLIIMMGGWEVLHRINLQPC